MLPESKEQRSEVNLSFLFIGSTMESLLKIAITKAPLSTLGTALLYFVIIALIENNLIQDIDTPKLVITLGAVLLFSISLLTYGSKLDSAKSTIRDVSVEDIDSISDMVIGKKSGNKYNSGTAVEGIKIKGAKTGGDFIIGEKLTNNE